MGRGDRLVRATGSAAGGLATLEPRPPDFSPPFISVVPTGWRGQGQSSLGRVLAHHPLPVTLGFLDQQPGCCAGIRGHKRPHSRQGRGGSVGSPAPGARCDNQSFQSTEARISRGWGQRGILGSGARERSQTIPGAGATGYSGTAGPGFQAPHSSRPLSGAQSPTCKPTPRAVFKEPSRTEE